MNLSMSEECMVYKSTTGESCDTQLVSSKRTYWKQQLRKKMLTKPIMKRDSLKLQDSSKTKNIPKNVSKAIVQFILTSDISQLIECDSKEFVGFVRKNKNILNLKTFLRLLSPNKNPKIDVHHTAFRKASYFFLRNLYVAYIFNSKIKDPQWHLQYRNNLIVFLQNL